MREEKVLACFENIVSHLSVKKQSLLLILPQKRALPLKFWFPAGSASER